MTNFCCSLVSLSFITEIDVVLSHTKTTIQCASVAHDKNLLQKIFPHFVVALCFSFFFFRSFSQKEEFVPFLYFLCARIFFFEIRLCSHCCCFYFACCCCCFVVVVIVVVFSNSILRRQLQSGPMCIKGQIYSVVNALYVDPINLVNTFQLNAWRNCAFDGGHNNGFCYNDFLLQHAKQSLCASILYQTTASFDLFYNYATDFNFKSN